MKHKFVTNIKFWQQMDGETELEKRLNAYLTGVFVGRDNVPSDECINEARDIIDFIKKNRELLDG